MLGHIVSLMKNIVVTGSHGKTTTTSLLSSIFGSAKLDPTIINGGVLNSFGNSAKLGKSNWCLIVSDESDGSFLKIPFTYSIITNIDSEHLDFYKSLENLKKNFSNFIEKTPSLGKTFLCIDDKNIKDKSVSLNLDKVTGGRAVVSGHILTDRSDIFAANERGANFLLKNNNGFFEDVAFDYRVDDVIQNGRGTALSDILYRGRLDIISGNWQGYHRAYVLQNNQFKDIGSSEFDKPSRIRTIISADFDNDGYDEVFMNNIAEPNKLFRIKKNGIFEEIILETGLETDGFGTGAAVADIDDDGILELLVSRGESKEQPLTLYKAKVDNQRKYLRIKPINKFGAPARGATVTLITNQRKHSKTIDAGSGYLCQMEPVAHYGIRKDEKDFKVEVKWTDGTKNLIKIESLNQAITIKQK